PRRKRAGGGRYGTIPTQSGLQPVEPRVLTLRSGGVCPCRDGPHAAVHQWRRARRRAGDPGRTDGYSAAVLPRRLGFQEGWGGRWMVTPPERRIKDSPPTVGNKTAQTRVRTSPSPGPLARPPLHRFALSGFVRSPVFVR